jgi:steroid delta-isomerase-like uncharacterized protein
MLRTLSTEIRRAEGDGVDIERTLMAYAEAKNRHDVEAVLAACHDDCFYESVGLGPRVQGRDALRAFYTALFAALPDYFGDFEGVVYREDVAVAWGRFGGTVAGDFMGVPAERGRTVAVPVTFVCTFRDGLLASDVGYFDAATLCAQAGIPLGRLRPGPGDDFVRRFAEFWANPDPALIPELVAPDVSAQFPGVEGRVSGVDAYQEQIARALSAVPDLRLEVLDHLAEGDRVLIEWRGRCTIGGETVELEGVDGFRVRDGRVVDARVVYDTGVLRQAVERAAGTPAAA